MPENLEPGHLTPTPEQATPAPLPAPDHLVTDGSTETAPAPEAEGTPAPEPFVIPASAEPVVAEAVERPEPLAEVPPAEETPVTSSPESAAAPEAEEPAPVADDV